ncbi:hypothetical protein COO60DRAFT_1698426 [Scenedesmus sp. NREL 46B-D3]|nr:hypothetical protein COO60DRAFT_1698426 [Scenedesmus sp. NREL 46B-D3]
MRSRDPGPDDCLDIQVETASGKKDLRMRCQSESAVQDIIADIRQTVQAIMNELDPAKASKGSPLKAAAAAATADKSAPPSPTDAAQRFDTFTRRVDDSHPVMSPAARTDRMMGTAADAADAAARAVAACAAGFSECVGSPPPQQQQKQGYGSSSRAGTPDMLQQEQQLNHASPARRSLSSNFRLAQKQQQQQQDEQQLQRGLSSASVRDHGDSAVYGSHLSSSMGRAGSPARAAALRMLDTKEMELDVPAEGSLRRHGAGAPVRRSTGDLAEFAGEAAAQIAFLEDMVSRLSHELSSRLGDVEARRSSLHSSLLEEARVSALPPWMADSRYLNPLLSAYDQRLNDAQADLASKTNAVRDIKAKVHQLVEENESLHDRLAEQASRMEGRALLREGSFFDGADRARLQERLELLEHENDLLVRQQSELDGELRRLGRQLAERDQQLVAVSDVAAHGTSRVDELERSLAQAKKAAGESGMLRDKVKELSDRLNDQASRTAEAIAAADTARQQQHALQAELAAAQSTARMVPGLQGELSKARTAAEAASSQVGVMRGEADGLRAALHAVEGRLTEYQEKDTEVYLRIKEAMELAEEARLERDAARTETDALQAQLSAAQARLQEAARQLSGGGGDGLSFREVRQRLVEAEGKLAQAARAEEEQAAKLSELRLTAERLSRDKASLYAELAGLKEELELCSFSSSKSGSLSDRLAEAERARDDAVQKLDSHKRAAARSEREWELQRQQLQGDVQRLAKRVAAAEEAAAAAAAASAEAQQAAAASEGEVASFRAARGRVESELRQQLVELRQEREAEVAALVQKLERALATCDKSVVDAEQMLVAKDSLLRRWKQEAQLIASKLEVALQQHQAELAERQAQVMVLTQQLTAAHEQQELLQQELDTARMTCQEAELLLGEAECRAAAASASVTTQQDDIMQELHTLQTQLERSQLDKLRAERARDGVAAKLGRMLQAGNATLRSSLQSMDDAPHQPPSGSPARSAVMAGFMKAACGDAAGEQPPCSRALFGTPPRSPASSRGPPADPAPSAAGAAATAAAAGAARMLLRGSATASCSPRSSVSNSSSHHGSRGSLSARDALMGWVPARAAASAVCSPDGKARGLSIATHAAEQQGKDQ